MKRLHNKYYWLSTLLGLLAVFLLIRVLVVDETLLLSEDLDVIVLLTLLAVAMVVAIHTIVRISINYLRLHSIQQVRRETLAEHNRFLNRLDHEFKNPLTTLRTGLKTLMLTPLNAQQQQLVETMETETLRLSRLVTDLRKLADLEAQPLQLKQIQIVPFMTGIVEMEQDRFVTGDRILLSKLEAEPREWVVDEDLLALAIHNLLDNAFKYSQPGDTVRVAVQAHQELTIQIQDTGMGIGAQALPQIWEELYREQRLERIPGSGTGLALVRTIVERHQGSVHSESQVGQGTTITLTLPRLSQL